MANRLGSVLTALLLLGSAACTPVATGGSDGAPRPASESTAPAVEAPVVEGRWTGFISVEGQGVNGILDLDQEATDLLAVFQAPDFGLLAEGRGLIAADGGIVLRLAYDLQCPGIAEMIGERSPDGAVLQGTLTASDCTGSSEGSFTFRR